MISKRFGAFLFITVSIFFSVYMYNEAKLFVPASSSISDKTVIIDAGHGIPDGGAVSSSGIQESEINLKIALKLKKLLEKAKVNVIMTRDSENSLSTLKKGNKSDDMKKRVNIRDNSGGDIFISIHLNHFSQSQYRGAQVFYNPSSEHNGYLAKNLQTKLIEIADPINTRNIKETNDLFILNGAKLPSVLVECGFLSNEEEAVLLSDEKYQKTIARALYLGICEFFCNDEY